MENISEQICKAVMRIIKPLIRLLLRNGIAYGTFAELVRKGFIEVAEEMLIKSDKKPTVSAISAMSGLTRKETKRLKEIEFPDSKSSDLRFNRAARVVSGWMNDRDFINSKGKPKDLPMEGDNSFSELTKRYSGDIPTIAMLSILERAKCVEKSNDKLRLVVSGYISGKDPLEKVQILGVDTAELLETIDHNISANNSELRFQRKVSNLYLDPKFISEFKELSAQKSQSLLEELDAWLSDHEVNNKNKDKCYYVALGAFYFEEIRNED